MSANDLRDEIIIKSQAGVGLREIEETVIEPSALAEDEQAALWLLAWSLPTAGSATRSDQSEDRMIPDDPSSDADPTRADLGKTSAHGDQTGSDHDQMGSDRDQDAADRDQAASDQDQATESTTSLVDSVATNMTAAARPAITPRRHAKEPHTNAIARRWRGIRSRANGTWLRRCVIARPRHATVTLTNWTLRSLAPRPAWNPSNRPARRRSPAKPHASGSAQPMTPGSRHRTRGEAARDRAEAARDRLSAAQDRAHAATEREAAPVSEPSGAKRTGPGLAAVQRQIDRARRGDGLLVVACVDLGRLQATNDIDDHDVGDDRVKRLVGVMKAHLCRDELIVRLGGDEFLCALPGATIENVGRRVQELARELTASPDASRVTIGLAELVLDDNGLDLVERARAHADLLAVGREDRSAEQHPG